MAIANGQRYMALVKRVWCENVLHLLPKMFSLVLSRIAPTPLQLPE